MKKFLIYCEEFPEGFTLKDAKRIERAMRGFVESDVNLAIEIVFTEEEEIRRLNREQRNTDKVTDVLSFPTLDDIKGKKLLKGCYPDETDEKKNLLIGSVAVCVKRAKEQAEEYGHSFAREINYLIIHGIMHCLGYDHMNEEEKAEMREKEEFILNKMKITREEGI